MTAKKAPAKKSRAATLKDLKRELGPGWEIHMNVPNEDCPYIVTISRQEGIHTSAVTRGGQTLAECFAWLMKKDNRDG